MGDKDWKRELGKIGKREGKERLEAKKERRERREIKIGSERIEGGREADKD